MLIPKRTNKKQIILAVVIIAIGIGVYFFWDSQKPKGTDSFIDLLEEVPGVATIKAVALDLSLLKDPRFLDLVDRSAEQYSDQYFVTASDSDAVPRPTDIKVIDPKTGTKLIIAWTSPNGEYKHFRLYRSEKQGVLGEILADNINGNSEEDTDVERGKSYYYTVRAVSSAGEESTNEQQVASAPKDTTYPLPPTNVQLQNSAEQLAVEITWQNPPDEDFDLVKIYRSERLGLLGTLIVDERLPAASYVDKNVESGVTYYYIFSSVDKSGNTSPIRMTPQGGNAYIFEPF